MNESDDHREVHPPQPQAAAESSWPRAYPLAFAGFAAATVALLWGFEYLPMTDLPQHASQVAVWMHYHEPAYGYREVFELNLFTPYLLGYLLARAFATVLPLVAAMKLVVTLAVLAQPAAMHYLLGRSGGDRWWALAAFPAAMGYSFRWGFLNFIVAAPLAMLLIAVAFDYADRPTRARAAALALLACLLFWAHLVLMAFGCAAAGLVIACRAWQGRAGIARTVVRMLPLAAPLPLTVFWLWHTMGANPMGEDRGTVWGLSARRLGLPLLVLSNPSDVAGGIASAVLLALLAGALLALRGGFRGGRAGRDVSSFMPGVTAVATYLLIPNRLLGVVFLWQRFGSLTFLLACAAARPPASVRVRAAVRAGILAVSAGWLVLQATRFAHFNHAAAGFEEIVDHMRPHARVMSRIRQRDGINPRDSAFLHFADYYVARKGGVAVFSAAFHAHALARFRPGAVPPNIGQEFAWNPEEFSWPAHAGYDYYLLRSAEDPAAAVFKSDAARLRLTAHAGAWWLYEPVEPG